MCNFQNDNQFYCLSCGYPQIYTEVIPNIQFQDSETRGNFQFKCPHCLHTISIYPGQEGNTNLNKELNDNRFVGPSGPFQPGGQQFPFQFPPFQPTPPRPQQPGPSPQISAPTSPPPSITPTESPQLKAVDPGTIRGCLYRYTYIWPERGFPYWFYPTRVARRSVSGYRWNGFMWMYYGTDLDNIRSFTCY